jgi:hypothetical protein
MSRFYNDRAIDGRDMTEYSVETSPSMSFCSFTLRVTGTAC